MKYVNASEITTTEALKAALQEVTPVKAIAVIGDGEPFKNLWNGAFCGVPCGEDDLFICFVDYPNENNTESGLASIRNTAVWELFRQWTDAGLNRRKAKSPFGCKSFSEFVDIDKYCSEVSYVVFLRKRG